MANVLDIALAGSIADDRKLIKEQTDAGDFQIDLDAIATRIKDATGFDVQGALVDAVKAEIAALDAKDTTPGDGAYELGYAKHIPIRATLFGFIRISDGINVDAGLVAGVKQTA